MTARGILLILGVALAGCRSRPPPPPAPPEPPPAGLVQLVNAPERYLVFEAPFTVPGGQEMRIVRDGLPIGRARSLGIRRRGIQSADILEGIPRPGDFVLPERPPTPDPAAVNKVSPPKR